MGLIFVAVTVAYFWSQSNLDAADYYQRAQTLHSEGKPKAAIIELKNALQNDAAHLDSRWLLGEIYLALGDGLGAEKEFEHARELGKQGPEVRINLLRAMLLQLRWEEVIGALLSEPSVDQDPALLLIRARANFGRGKLELVRPDLEAALELDPGFSEAQRVLARLAIFEEDSDEAERLIDQSLEHSSEGLESWVLKGEISVSKGELEEARTAFTNALRISDDHLLARIGMTRTLLALGEPDAALEHIDVLALANPHNPTSYYFRALVAQQKRDMDGMQDSLREVLRMVPSHSPSLRLMGALHYERHENEQAEEVLSRYLELVPTDLTATRLLGAVYVKQREFERAISILESAREQLSNDAQTLALLGTAYMGKGEFDTANDYLQWAASQQPDAAAIRAQLGLSYLALGNTTEGRQELQSAATFNPEFRIADYLLVQVHINNGELDEALKIAEELASAEPENPLPPNMMGNIHERMGHTDEARKLYTQALSLKPEYSSAELNLARLDLKVGDIADSKNRFQKVHTREPENLTALRGLAYIARQEGRRKVAITLLNQVRKTAPQDLETRLTLVAEYLDDKDHASALPVLEEAEALAPDDLRVLSAFGEIQLARGDNQAAWSTFSKLTEQAPLVADAHYRLGVAQARSGKLKKAQASWEKALSLDPDNLSSKGSLARLALMVGRVDDALAVADDLQQTHPQSPLGWTIEADVRMRQLDVTRAIDAYQAALETGDNRDVIVKLAAAHRVLGKTRAADEVMESWLEKYPKDVSVLNSFAVTLQNSGQTERAHTYYERVLIVQPRNLVALNNLAWLYSGRRDERALDFAKRAYESAPRHPKIIDTYGWFLVQDGKIEQGLTLLSKAVEQAPENGNILYHRAAGLARAGDVNEARSLLASLLEKKIPFSERSAAQSLLQELQ